MPTDDDDFLIFDDGRTLRLADLPTEDEELWAYERARRLHLFLIEAHRVAATDWVEQSDLKRLQDTLQALEDRPPAAVPNEPLEAHQARRMAIDLYALASGTMTPEDRAKISRSFLHFASPDRDGVGKQVMADRYRRFLFVQAVRESSQDELTGEKDCPDVEMRLRRILARIWRVDATLSATLNEPAHLQTLRDYFSAPPDLSELAGRLSAAEMEWERLAQLALDVGVSAKVGGPSLHTDYKNIGKALRVVP